jgi:hypothetical protein
MLAEVEREQPPLADAPGREPTLGDLVAGIWEGLAAHETVACPACGGRMEPEYGPQALPIGGRCTICGTSLS